MNTSIDEIHEVDKTYRSIQVSNLIPGQGDVVATLDLKVGGVFVRGLSLRRGRNNSVFLNYPSFKNSHGRWVRTVEITSPSLEAAVREEVYRAVAEATR